MAIIPSAYRRMALRRHFFLCAFLLFLCGEMVSAQAVEGNRFEAMQVRAEHPRIWIDAKKIGWLRQKCHGLSAEEIAQKAGPSVIGMALSYVISGDTAIGRKAIAAALGEHADPGSVFPDLNGPDGINKRNAPQATVVDQAICYDWCYKLLNDAEKTALRGSMIQRMKKYIDFKRTWRSFHNRMYNAAWPVTAGMLAMYGDDPFAEETFRFLKPELEDAMRTFDLVFPDGEWGEGMDYNRHSSYHALRIMLALKTATGVDVISESPHFRNTGQYILYASKPNGLALASDDNDWPYTGPWEHLALLMLNEEYHDGFNQYFINHCPVDRFHLEPADQYATLLWYDPAIVEKPLSDLPLSRIFRGKGLVLARSTWQWDQPGKRAGTWLSFHCGDYMGDHAHFDVNSFAISHGGELALDAGRYDDDWGVDDWKQSRDSSRIRQSQFFNYYQRTIAHNTMLVRDPTERIGLNLLNDGGQLQLLRVNGVRNVPEDYDQGNFPSEDGTATCDWAKNPGRWETGDIKSYKATKDFIYASGDGSKAYSTRKMESYVRQLVFLQPGTIVVMDRVVSRNPAFKKTWLLHTVNEPGLAVDGSFSISDKEGTLACIPLLPRKRLVAKVGGPGNEFLVDTTHFRAGMQSVIAPSELHYAEIPGAWRIEQSPSFPAAADFFLNVLQAGDKVQKNPAAKIVAETKNFITVSITRTPGEDILLRFGKGPSTTAHITIRRSGQVITDEEMPRMVLPEQGRF